MPEWKHETACNDKSEMRKETDVQMVGSNRKTEKEPCGGKQNGDKEEKYDARAKYQKDHGCGSRLIAGFFFGKETSDWGYGSLWHNHGLPSHLLNQQIESRIKNFYGDPPVLLPGRDSRIFSVGMKIWRNMISHHEPMHSFQRAARSPMLLAMDGNELGPSSPASPRA